MRRLAVTVVPVLLLLAACGSSDPGLSMPSAMPTADSLTVPTGSAEPTAPSPDAPTSTGGTEQGEQTEPTGTTGTAQATEQAAGETAPPVNPTVDATYGSNGTITDKKFVTTLLNATPNVPTVTGAAGYDADSVEQALRTALALSTAMKNNTLTHATGNPAAVRDTATSAASLYATRTATDRIADEAVSILDTYRTDSGNDQHRAYWRWAPVTMCADTSPDDQTCLFMNDRRYTVKDIAPFRDGTVRGLRITVAEDYGITTTLGDKARPARGTQGGTVTYTVIENPDPASAMRWLVADLDFGTYYTALTPLTGGKKA